MNLNHPIPEGYREINQGEIIKEGDKTRFRRDKGRAWYFCKNFVGKVYDKNDIEFKGVVVISPMSKLKKCMCCEVAPKMCIDHRIEKNNINKYDLPKNHSIWVVFQKDCVPGWNSIWFDTKEEADETYTNRKIYSKPIKYTRDY